MSIPKIKDNISETQFKLLINSLKGNENVRRNRKKRLIKTFTLLYYLGIGINETTQFTNNMILELLQNRKIVIESHKQHSEKYIYLTQEGYKVLSKVFGQDTRITSHLFRQTLISNLATAGLNTKIIQNPIGHKSINTTYR